jgi:hypothetical protein
MRNPSKFWGIEAEMRHCCCRVHLGSSAIRNAARAAVLHSFFLFFGGTLAMHPRDGSLRRFDDLLS